jgi:hypothetical protein
MSTKTILLIVVAVFLWDVLGSWNVPTTTSPAVQLNKATADAPTTSEHAAPKKAAAEETKKQKMRTGDDNDDDEDDEDDDDDFFGDGGAPEKPKAQRRRPFDDDDDDADDGNSARSATTRAEALATVAQRFAGIDTDAINLDVDALSSDELHIAYGADDAAAAKELAAALKEHFSLSDDGGNAYDSFRVVVAPYALAKWAAMMLKVASAFQISMLLYVMLGERIMKALNITNPTLLNAHAALQGAKAYVSIGCWLLGSVLQRVFGGGAAFEVAYDNTLLSSKALADCGGAGCSLDVDDIVRLVEAMLQPDTSR